MLLFDNSLHFSDFCVIHNIMMTMHPMEKKKNFFISIIEPFEGSLYEIGAHKGVQGSVRCLQFSNRRFRISQVYIFILQLRLCFFQNQKCESHIRL